MVSIVFSIYDSKAECFTPPFSYPAVGQAVRQFSDFCNDPNHPIGKHYSDYRLYRIGSFDDSDGNIITSIPAVLCTGDECVGSRDAKGLRVVNNG